MSSGYAFVPPIRVGRIHEYTATPTVAIGTKSMSKILSSISMADYLIKYTCVGMIILGCISACSKGLEINLFNNTSGPITVHSFTQHFVQRERQLLIGSQMSARFNYPSRELLISVGGCEVRYALPLTLHGYPFPRDTYNVPVQAQLQPDLAIYLLPPGIGTTAAVSDIGAASLHVDGFPLRPSSSGCPDRPRT